MAIYSSPSSTTHQNLEQYKLLQQLQKERFISETRHNALSVKASAKYTVFEKKTLK